MTLYSFHLAHLPPFTAMATLLRPPRAQGLVHSEVFSGMELGAAIVSTRRMQLKRTAVFAEWVEE